MDEFFSFFSKSSRSSGSASATVQTFSRPFDQVLHGVLRRGCSEEASSPFSSFDELTVLTVTIG